MTSDVSADVLVRVRGLHFGYGSRAVFEAVDLDIPRGSVTAILGPSGSGKTTLLRLIGGQWFPRAGTVEVDGVNVHTLRRSALYELRKRMGMLFQNGALLTDYSVFENVAFPIREHTRLPESIIRKLVLMKLRGGGVLPRCPRPVPGRALRRHGAARGAGARHRAGSDDDHVRRALHRTGSDHHGRADAAHPHPQRCPRADLHCGLARRRRGAVDLGLRLRHLRSQGTCLAARRRRSRRAPPSGCVSFSTAGPTGGPVRFHYDAPDLAKDLLESDA